MNIYTHEHGVTLTGKAWEIKAKLKEQQKSFHTIDEWVKTVYPNKEKPVLRDSAIAKKKIGSSS